MLHMLAQLHVKPSSAGQLSQSTVFAHAITCQTVGWVDLIEMRKTDSFGETRLVPHVPSSYELECEFIIIIIMLLLITCIDDMPEGSEFTMTAGCCGGAAVLLLS